MKCENKEDFEEKWQKISSYISMTIETLEDTKDGFGVTIPSELPFEPMIPVMASLLREIENRFRDKQKKCYDKLENWYWTSVFSNSYSSAVDSQKTSDFKEMIDWFVNDDSIPKNIKKFRIEYPLLDLKSVEQPSNAMYRGILSLVALAGGYDFDKNRSVTNKKYQKDHIFPKSQFTEHENVNSILNMTWLTPDTNQRIKKAKMPSLFIEETIRDKYNGETPTFLETLESHLISNDAYLCMNENNFDGFLEERNKTILSIIGKKIGAESKTVITTVTRPETPFDNELLIEDTIKKCDGYIQWVDRYFRSKGLRWLSRYMSKQKVKEVKILTSIDTADEELRDLFKAFRKQMSNENIACEMRVIVDNKLKGQIHGRWLIAKNDCFNFLSVDTVSRGAHDEIRSGATRPPFKEWWDKSFDIVEDWNKIQNNKETPGNL